MCAWMAVGFVSLCPCDELISCIGCASPFTQWPLEIGTISPQQEQEGKKKKRKDGWMWHGISGLNDDGWNMLRCQTNRGSVQLWKDNM